MCISNINVDPTLIANHSITIKTSNSTNSTYTLYTLYPLGVSSAATTETLIRVANKGRKFNPVIFLIIFSVEELQSLNLNKIELSFWYVFLRADYGLFEGLFIA